MPDGVDAPVVVEALVLGGDDGVAQRLRDVGQRHEDPALDVQLGDQLVVVVVDLGADERLERLQRGDRGERAGQDGEGPQGSHGHPGADEQGDDTRGDEEPPQPPPPTWPSAACARLAGSFFSAAMRGHYTGGRPAGQPRQRAIMPAPEPRACRHRYFRTSSARAHRRRHHARRARRPPGRGVPHGLRGLRPHRRQPPRRQPGAAPGAAALPARRAPPDRAGRRRHRAHRRPGRQDRRACAQRRGLRRGLRRAG